MNGSSEPFAWENRLYRVPAIGGWSVEVWNPMTKEWQRSPFAPHWPDGCTEAATAWVEAENEAQRARNREVGL